MDSRFFWFMRWGWFIGALLIVSCVDSQFPNNLENERDLGVAKFVDEQVSANDYLGGYASKVSVAQGETIDFHVSTNINGLYDLTIWREGVPRELKQTIHDVTGVEYGCAEGYMGCGWPVTASITIPTDWASGTYMVDIPTLGSKQRITFWVREDNPGSTGRILFLSAVNTYNAYTNYGGKSLYDYNSSYGKPAYKVSFNRPYNHEGRGYYPYWDGKFPIWAAAQGYDIEFAADYDLEFIPDLLTHYDVVIISGHSEYWTWNMRDRVKSFVHNGGRFVNLSGNTMWWQIRYENNGRTMVAYKDYRIDPVQDRTLVTDYNWDYPIYDTEYAVTGSQFAKGGMAPSGSFTNENGYGGFSVQKADHWVFENTNLQNRDMFGRTEIESTSVIEHEIDGTTFNCAPDGSSIIGPLGNTGTPYNYTILAIAPAIYSRSIGFGNMGIYTVEGGGAVFSANTIGWVTALNDTAVSQITQNVLDRFLSDQPLPQEPVASTDTNYLFYDRFNCNQLHDNWLLPVAPEWDTIQDFNYYTTLNTTNTRYTNACGIDGSGLEITINHENDMVFKSQVKPNWGGTDALYTRMNLNLSNLSMTDNTEFDLFRHYHDTRQGGYSLEAQIQIRWIDGMPHLRYRPSGQNPPWHQVPHNRWFSLETLWDKESNLISVWIGETRFDFPANLDDKLTINRVDTVLKGVDNSTSGHICLDEYAFDTQRIGDFNFEQFEVQLSESHFQNAFPGDIVTFTNQITNIGTTEEAFNIDIMNDLSWDVTIDPTLTKILLPGESTDLKLTVQVPSSAIPDTSADISITATAVSEKSTDSVTDRIIVDQIPTFEVQLSEAQALSALPGETITITHQIVNIGTEEDAFTIDMINDPAWDTTCNPTQTEMLASGETAELMLVVQVPSSALANTIANIAITVTGENEQSTATVMDVINVDQVTRMDLTSTISVVAKAEQEVVLAHTITNLGNASDSFNISASTGMPEWQLSINPTTVGPIDSGEQASFEITVQVPSNLTGAVNKVVTIDVASQENPQNVVTVVDEIVVESFNIYLPLITTK